MKPRFEAKVPRPLAVQPGERLRHVRLDGPVGPGHRRLDEKAVFEDRHMVTQAVGHEQLVAALNLFAVGGHVLFQGVHGVDPGVQALPPEALIDQRDAEAADVAGVLPFGRQERLSEGNAQRPAVFLGLGFHRHHIFRAETVAEVELDKIRSVL